MFREDDTEQKEFVEADIDAILQRRAHKVFSRSSPIDTHTYHNIPQHNYPARLSMRRMELWEGLHSEVLARHHS